MKRWLWIAVDIMFFAIFSVAAVYAWHAGVRHTAFVADGDQPAFTSTHYSGSWLGLSVLLATAAGLFALDLLVRAVSRPRRGPVHSQRW
ncbi:hypothetical protein [Nocardia aurantia]|uniref:Uncharacterized protein n=1 Tax=Nocardia aurantia TaxID=2585199 RepID=A0A7K0DZC3_9NOCA|nr:hypothetical protein [Nocardia aurantia]MQY30204.1 hypothetical protein [Nocardia aurantia]